MIYCMHLLNSKCRLYTTPNWNLHYLIWNYCPFVYLFWWSSSKKVKVLTEHMFFEELHQNFGEAPQKRSNAYSMYYKLFDKNNNNSLRNCWKAPSFSAIAQENVNNNKDRSIYYYAKSVCSISAVLFARLLKTSRSSLYIYFIPLWF